MPGSGSQEMMRAPVGAEGTRWAELGPGFVRRVLITTSWLGVLVALCVAVYIGLPKAAAWGAGLLLGIANLLSLNGLFKEMLRPAGGRTKALIAYVALKFPAIYLAGALALIKLRLDPLYLLAGFSLFLAVSLLKVLGRLVLSRRWMSGERRGPGGTLLRGGAAGRRSA